MTLAIAAWKFSVSQMDTRIMNRFVLARDRALGLVVDRITRYEDALWAGTAAIESLGGDISLQEWQTFANSLRIEEKYPGINGIGVIHYQTPLSLDGFLAEQRDARPTFRLYPQHDQPFLMPITYIEPVRLNSQAVGLDVAHEVNRRTAALLARDTGTAQITGPIVLVQDAGNTPGFLFYAPFYRGGAPDSVSERKDRFLGAVYAPFIVHKLMEGLLAKGLRDIRFSIRDGDQLIYNEHTPDDPLYDPDPMFKEFAQLELYGRTWTFDIRADLAFRDANTYAQPTMILAAGIVIETLIISLMFLMARANHRAVAYADKVTADLRRNSKQLCDTNTALAGKNEELEQFAYVASHDLKTPIRGIGGLTEMIQEDLEDYLASPKANPDVGHNLELIHDRVRRMTELTEGIMQFSRVGVYDDGDAVLCLDETIQALVSDFGLAADQVVLRGDVKSIETDAFNFRRVLENLVGNAVKYHQDRQALRIEISVRAVDGRYAVSVSDNGEGIDPKFHQRIFGVFQTLRASGAPGSTGIGLSIVKKCVERHGGTVTVASALGEGACFSFDWPGKANDDRFARSDEAA